MTTQHTPGKLEYFHTRIYFANSAGGFDIRGCPDAEANARRLVACWNACDRFSTEFLEKAASYKDGLPWVIQDLEQQNTELARLLRHLMVMNEISESEFPEGYAALAKVEGKTP